MTQRLEDLTRVEKTQRAEDIVRAAWPAWGGTVGSLRVLGDGFNTVFCGASSAHGRVVVRVHRRDGRSVGAMGVEAQWLERLDGRGVQVPRLIRAATGAPYATVETIDPTAPRWVSVFAWQEGQTLAGHLNAANSETELIRRVGQLGALAARLHADTSGFHALDSEAARHDNVLGSNRDALTQAGIPARLVEPLHAARTICDATFAAAISQPQQLCHADLHTGNALVYPDDSLGLIDFDDCALMSPAYDLGIAVFYLGAFKDPDGLPPTGDAIERRVEAFANGYAGMRPWPVTDEALLPFVIARQVYLLNLFAQDPNTDYEADFLPYCERVADRLEAWLSRGLYP